MSENTIPCVTCGEPTEFFGTRLCTNCWEVESRLDKYLQSPGGKGRVRNKMPLLDDWIGGKPDSWDYETLLTENSVKVVRNNTVDGWTLSWKHGTMHIGNTTGMIARKAAALFVSLWQRGVSASFADKLMDGFIVYLERQEGITKSIMAKAEYRVSDMVECLYLRLGNFPEENRILREFGLKAGDQVGVTLSKLEG